MEWIRRMCATRRPLFECCCIPNKSKLSNTSRKRRQIDPSWCHFIRPSQLAPPRVEWPTQAKWIYFVTQETSSEPKYLHKTWSVGEWIAVRYWRKHSQLNDLSPLRSCYLNDVSNLRQILRKGTLNEWTEALFTQNNPRTPPKKIPKKSRIFLRI